MPIDYRENVSGKEKIAGMREEGNWVQLYKFNVELNVFKFLSIYVLRGCVASVNFINQVNIIIELYVRDLNLLSCISFNSCLTCICTKIYFIT